VSASTNMSSRPTFIIHGCGLCHMDWSGKLHAAQHVFRQLHLTNGFVLDASLDTLHQRHALSYSVGHCRQSQHGLTPMHKLQAWRQSAASVNRSVNKSTHLGWPPF